jgi:hypothetical protein
MTAATNCSHMVFILLPSIWKAESWVKWKKLDVSVYSCYTEQDWHTTILPWYYKSGKRVAKWCSVTVYSSIGFASSIISLLFKPTHTHTPFSKWRLFISSYDTAFLFGNGKNAQYLSTKHHMPLTNLTLTSHSINQKSGNIIWRFNIININIFISSNTELFSSHFLNIHPNVILPHPP